jgi:hypothetical protein
MSDRDASGSERKGNRDEGTTDDDGRLPTPGGLRAMV